MFTSRRRFLRGIAAGTALATSGLARHAFASSLPTAPAARSAHDLARDEVFWRGVAESYDRTEGILNLGHGYWAKMARPVQATYLEALEEHKPDILGMSALLTTTMPYMKVVIDTMKEKGIRDDYIVLVGGAPLNQEFGEAIGADAYCRDAAVAADTAKQLVAERRAAA